MHIFTDADLIEELAKLTKNPTTVVISRKRYAALCKEYTPNNNEFETIKLENVVTSNGILSIQVTDSRDNTLTVR